MALGCGAVLALALTACTQIPRDAPTGDAIRADAALRVDAPGERVPYALVRLSASIAHQINASGDDAGAAEALARLPARSAGPADARISVGDMLSITIFEAQSGGLFIPNEAGARAGNFVALPIQQVDTAGFITVPYIGNVRVVGSDPRTVSKQIADKLKSRAIEPQVVVTINERRGKQVSIIGEVNAPARFPLDPGGVRLSGAVARAGGPKYPVYDTVFTLERGGSTYRAPLAAVFRDPKLDVQLAGDDVVYLARQPKYVTVFGATLDPTLTSITRRVTFESDQMTLAEALAKAGGLNSQRADLRSIFVFRIQSRRSLSALGVDVARYKADQVPTVFSVDLGQADGFFLSNEFKLHSQDIVVAADSPYVDTLKYLSLLNAAFVVPASGATIGVAATR